LVWYPGTDNDCFGALAQRVAITQFGSFFAGTDWLVRKFFKSAVMLAQEVGYLFANGVFHA
jgi:hypothetical protein